MRFRLGIVLAATLLCFGQPALATNCITTVACVIGQNTSTGASSDIGVEGLSSHGFGLVGVSSANPSNSAGRVAGLYGKDQGPSPYDSGVSAFSQNGTGLIAFGVNGMGVEGITTSGTVSSGVFGADDGTNSANAGVSGFSTNGLGVFGSSQNGAAVSAYSEGGTGVALFAQGGTQYPAAEFGTTGPGYIMAGFNNTSGSAILEFAFDGAGNEAIAGSISTVGGTYARTRSTSGTDVASYGARSASPTLEDFGQAVLTSGYAHVSLDPTFASTIDTRSYLVFVTPHGDSHGLYTTIANGGFNVRENGQGRSTLSFDYRIVGKPLDMASATRLPVASTLPQFTSATKMPRRMFALPARPQMAALQSRL